MVVLGTGVWEIRLKFCLLSAPINIISVDKGRVRFDPGEKHRLLQRIIRNHKFLGDGMPLKGNTIVSRFVVSPELTGMPVVSKTP